MLKKCVSLMMLFFPLALCAQVTRPYTDSADRAHFSSAKQIQKGENYLLKSAKVSQAAAQAQLKKLAKAYPAHAADLQQVVNLHKWLANLLRNEQKQTLDKNFYRKALSLLEDLSLAVSGLKDETLAQECTTAIDHGYYFAPLGERLVALRVVAEYIGLKGASQTKGSVQPRWGTFYQHLDGYSN